MQMRAIVVEGGSGPAEALRIAQVDRPEPGAGELLVRVRAAGVNRPDLLQRRGLYPPPPGAPETLGLEIAGEVVTAAGRWREGDRVVALLGGGGYADHAVVDARHALPLPHGLSFEEGAALPETVFTVFANVFEHGRLVLGETLLVHGANSGIGVAAIQMAAAAGARVIGTCRGADRADALRALGAERIIDTTAEDFGQAVRDLGGADVILDMVGDRYLQPNLAALNTDGRIVYIAALDGPTLQVPVMALMRKRAVLTGSTLRNRSADEKARLARRVEEVVWPWVAGGKVTPVVEAVFPLQDAAKAHARLEAGSHLGKIILTC
jgi:putative PIG3 family NAD(P)H quinone oxidoreductase